MTASDLLSKREIYLEDLETKKTYLRFDLIFYLLCMSDQPKMRQIFIERAPKIKGNTETPAFKAWFRNSKVVDKKGNPLVVFHSTRASQDFDVFRSEYGVDFGFHFGTADAAEQRWEDTEAWKKDDAGAWQSEKSGRTYPVYLSIQNPWDCPFDMMTWEPGEIAEVLVQAKIFSEPEMNQVKMKPDKKSAAPVLIALLKKKGYDGIKYMNDVEGRYNTFSWIVFDSNQIKSVFNKGTWDRRRGSIMEDD